MTVLSPASLVINKLGISWKGILILHITSQTRQEDQLADVHLLNKEMEKWSSINEPLLNNTLIIITIIIISAEYTAS